MAINPETQYPGKITASSASYPYGQARNITTPGDGTGTPWEAALVNDIFGFQQRMLSDAGIVPNGNPETVLISQYMNALVSICSKLFDNVTTALVAYTAVGNGQVVFAGGYDVLGDGGAGIYRYSSGQPAGTYATIGAEVVLPTGGDGSAAWIRMSLSPNMIENGIINGNFDFWEYATSQTATGYGSDDRWSNENSGSTKTHSRQTFTAGQTDVPGNPTYYSRTIVTTGGGASNYVRKQQKIEGVASYAGQTVVISLYAKADAAKDIAVELVQSFGTGGSPSADVTAIGVSTISLTTGWKKYTAIIDVPSISGKTIGTDGNDYLSIVLWFDAGSDYNARTDSLGNQSGTFDISRVQATKGPAGIDFIPRPKAVEGRLCFRYFYMGFNANSTTVMGTGYAITTTTARGLFASFRPPIRMRETAPAVTHSGSFDILRLNTAFPITTLTLSATHYGRSLSFEATCAGGGLAADAGCVIRSNNSDTSMIYFDAEL